MINTNTTHFGDSTMAIEIKNKKSAPEIIGNEIERHIEKGGGKTHMQRGVTLDPRNIVAIWGGGKDHHIPEGANAEYKKLLNEKFPPYFGVDFSETRQTKHYPCTSKGRYEAVQDILDWLYADEIQEGDIVDKQINQAIRECEVIKINKTRCRLAYEMPNAGMMGGWHGINKLFGKVFLKIDIHDLIYSR